MPLKKCNGILDVSKDHDMQCLECSEIVYYQPYDWGTSLNVVPSKNEEIN